MALKPSIYSIAKAFKLKRWDLPARSPVNRFEKSWNLRIEADSLMINRAGKRFQNKFHQVIYRLVGDSRLSRLLLNVVRTECQLFEVCIAYDNLSSRHSWRFHIDDEVAEFLSVPKIIVSSKGHFVKGFYGEDFAGEIKRMKFTFAWFLRWLNIDKENERFIKKNLHNV